MGDSQDQPALLKVTVQAGVATLTLNRPGQHNALSRALRQAITQTLERLNTDADVGVVVLTGAGERAFCVGADMKELVDAPLQASELGPQAELVQAFRAFRKPIIAAINGHAITGGFELALLCDVLVASPNARFADTHARVGMVSGWGLSQYLARVVGPVRARYLSLTGNSLDAATAQAWGLVLEVVPQADLLARCKQLAQDMLGCEPQALQDIRQAINEGWKGTLAAGLVLEAQLAAQGLERFDPTTFVARREATLRRGQAQQNS